MLSGVLEVISSWQVWELSITTRSAKLVFARGHTSRVATGALAVSAQDPGPLRGRSTTCPPASTPATTPLETLAPTPYPLELSFEAVAAKERCARLAGGGDGAVVIGVGVLDDAAGLDVVGLVVVGDDGAGIDVGIVDTRGATVACGEPWVRADVVIEKSITSRSTGLDHITS